MAKCSFSGTAQEVPFVQTRYRTIKTRIPVPESIAVFKDLEKYESRSMHGQLPIVWDKAEGFQVFDKYGNRWIDFTSTIFVTNSDNHLYICQNNTYSCKQYYSQTYIACYTKYFTCN